MTELLKRERPINHKKVRRVMKALGMSVRPRRGWIRPKESAPGRKVYPNLLAGMEIARVNQVWAADMTYIGLGRGYVYLAVILDLHSRKVIGWALGRQSSSELVIAALKAALESRGPVAGCLHHSDRGVQYASKEYGELLENSGLVPSMSRKANPYDNAYVESFMKTLKVEEVYLRTYRSFEEILASVPRFIEAVYNQKRLHSGLGYQSPNEFEQQKCFKRS